MQLEPMVKAKVSSLEQRLVQRARKAKISYRCSGLQSFVTSAFKAWLFQVPTYSLPSVA